MATGADLAAKAGGSSSPLLAAFGLVIALIALLLRYIQTSDNVKAVSETKSGGSKAGAKNKKIDPKVTLNPQADATYLVNCLRPDSTPLEILYAIASSPDTVAVTCKQIAIATDLCEKKKAHLKEKKTIATHKSMEDLFDDDDEGWAEDDENDPAAKAAQKAKEEKEKEARRLAKATGKDVTDFTKVKLEGIDEGVIGQQWVKSNLTKMGVWPPPSLDKSIIKSKTFDLDGKKVGPMEHPGVQRNLMMTMGRLNAKQLNTHPELIAAGPKGLIDPTYFQATAEYRQRVGQMLDATLRMACSLKCYRLASSILDTILMFKIGLMKLDSEETVKWFNELMVKQYGPDGVPKLAIEEKFLGVPISDPVKEAGKEKSQAEKKEAEKNRIARQIMQTKQVTTTDEKMALEMQITRQHAESFTKEKLAMCQRQNIPPQIAMQSYREAWFILVRATKIHENGTPDMDWDGALGNAQTGYTNYMGFLKEKSESLYNMLEPETIKSFEKEFGSKELYVENKIVIGWPFVISNVAQKTGKVKIHLPPPLEPGKYEFRVTMKSQDFVGVGEQFSLVVDVAKGVEKMEQENTENKKDK